MKKTEETIRPVINLEPKELLLLGGLPGEENNVMVGVKPSVKPDTRSASIASR